MLMSGNSVLEAFPVYRLTLKRQKFAKNTSFELKRKLSFHRGKLAVEVK